MFQTLTSPALTTVQHHVCHCDELVYCCKSARNFVTITGVFDCPEQCIFRIRPFNDFAVRVGADILQMVVNMVLNISGSSGHDIG